MVLGDLLTFADLAFFERVGWGGGCQSVAAGVCFLFFGWWLLLSGTILLPLPSFLRCSIGGWRILVPWLFSFGSFCLCEQGFFFLDGAHRHWFLALFLVVFYTMEYFFRILRGFSNRFSYENLDQQPTWWIYFLLGDTLWVGLSRTRLFQLQLHCILSIPIAVLRHHAGSLFPSHKTGMGCLLTSLTAMRDWSCTSSHATPSQIERREFCNGILMLSQKQMWMITPCICSSWREGNSPVLRRSALDGDGTGTMWLSILSSFGPSEL